MQLAITSERLHKQFIVIKQTCKLFPQRTLSGLYKWCFKTNEDKFVKSQWLQVNIEGQRKDGMSGQYDQICTTILPKGFDPHSVPSNELAASLRYDFPSSFLD